MSDAGNPTAANVYSQIIERIFLNHYHEGAVEVPFAREEIVQVAIDLGVPTPKNLGDVVYSFRYRNELPQAILDRTPEGRSWIIRPSGRSRYTFVAVSETRIRPNPLLVETKVPDATPGVIAKYAFSDEQALLARLRYNRLIDVFTGVACYSLQNHLRTSVPGMGQVETDEVYVGIDRRGVHYVFPVQAKGGKDVLSIVQVEQDVALCRRRFPSLICRPIAAQFMEANLIALFALEVGAQGVAVVDERHYRLVPPAEVTDADLTSYQQRPTSDTG